MGVGQSPPGALGGAGAGAGKAAALDWQSQELESLSRDDFIILALVPARRKTSARAAASVSCGCVGGGDAAADTAQQCSYYAAQQRLYTFDEAPTKLRFNRFIRSGYRAGLSYSQCLCSLMQLHNETVNIYSHLLPALGMLALLAGGSWQPWAGSQPAFAFNVASIWLCFMLSACFHTCMANHYCYDRWLKIDVCSVLLVLVGGGHGVLWWGLHCQPLALRAGFTLAYCLAGGACIIYSLRAGTATQRAGPMLVLLLIRLASFAMRAALSAAPSSALRHYLAMEACSLLGGLINVLRVPERWLQPTARDQPAPLDYFGNSHQLMHMLVALAMMHLHLGAAADHRAMAAIQAGTLSCAGH